MNDYLLRPNPDDPRLAARVKGVDQTGAEIETSVVVERPLTLFLNGQEIVTVMTIGDYPDYLAVGYLLNQNMLRPDDEITGIDTDDDLGVVVVRTRRETDYESKLKKKTLTSGCAQGTVFGDLMERFDEIELAPDAVLKTSWLYALTKTINTTPSLYLVAGAIHGCVLCRRDRALVYMEDVGRHNAVDKIAGYMFRKAIPPEDKFFYTTGRLTSEMVIKTVQMRADPDLALRLHRLGGWIWRARRGSPLSAGPGVGAISSLRAPSGWCATPGPAPRGRRWLTRALPGQIESILFLDRRGDPVVRRAPGRCGASAKSGLAAGRLPVGNPKGRALLRPGQTQPLGRIADTPFAPVFGLGAKSLCQNGSI